MNMKKSKRFFIALIIGIVAGGATFFAWTRTLKNQVLTQKPWEGILLSVIICVLAMLLVYLFTSDNDGPDSGPYDDSMPWMGAC